jgi:hypothetical protein
LVLCLASLWPAFADANSGPALAPAVPAPIAIPSGLDVTRATIAVRIDGRPYTCVLDTGTSTMLVSASVAQDAGLTPEAPVDELAPDGLRYADRHTHLPRFDVAGFTMRDVPALISSKLAGNTVLCGYDFFARIPTLIDRDRAVVTLFPLAAAFDRMRCVPVELTAHVPVATLAFNGARVDDVVLDSGMVGGGAIWNGVADRLPQALTPAVGYRADPRDLHDGLRCGQVATVELFSGAPYNPIALCASTQRPDGYNAIIETNVPTVHQLAIDYPNRRVCFLTEPSG